MAIEPSDEPQAIDLDKLTLDPRLQLRAYFHEDVAEEYGENLLKMPPPQAVVTPDGQVYVYDGFHTLKAAKDKGRRTFPVIVQAGTYDDAILLAAGANARHGIRRTREDKERAVRAILEHPKFGSYAARNIADICGVSDTFVGEIRSVYEAEVNARHEAEQRSGGNGKPAKRKSHKQKVIGRDGKLQARTKRKKPGRPKYDYPKFDRAVGELKRQMDRLYEAFGRVSAGGAVVKDDKYRAMADHLKSILDIFKKQYGVFSKEKAPEEVA